MLVTLKHTGYRRVGDTYVHTYAAFAESGWGGEYEDGAFVRNGSYELPDDMFSIDSGWVHWCCDSCGTAFWKRSRPGGSIECPMCNSIEQVPEDAQMEEYEQYEVCAGGA